MISKLALHKVKFIYLIALSLPLAYFPNFIDSSHSKYFFLVFVSTIALIYFLKTLFFNDISSANVNLIDLTMVLFLVICFLSSFLHNNKCFSWESILTISSSVIVYFLSVSTLRNIYHINMLLKYFLFGITLAGIVPIVQATISMASTGHLNLIRVAGVYRHPNELGLLSAFGLIILIYTDVNRWKRLVIGVILFIGLFLSLSRGAFLGFIFGLLVYAFISFNFKLSRGLIWKSTITIALLILALSVLLYFISPFQRDRLFQTSHASNLRRPLIYQGTLNMISKKPVLGWGIGSFNIFFQEFKPSGLYKLMDKNNVMVFHAHNFILEYLVELGLVGAIPLIGLLVLINYYAYMIYRSWRKNDEVNPNFVAVCYSSIILFLIHGLVNVELNYPLGMACLFILFSTISIMLRGISKIDNWHLQVTPPRTTIQKISVGFVFIIPISLASITMFNHATNSIYLKRAVIKITQERYKEALDYCINANQKYPCSEVGYYMAGNIYLTLQIVPKAIHAFEVVKEINPNYGRVDLRLGECYILLGQLNKANRYLKRYIYQNPDSNYPRLLYGKSLFHLGYIEMAIEELEHYTNHNNNDILALRYLMFSYRYIGYYDKAEIIRNKITDIIKSKGEINDLPPESDPG